MKKTLLTIFVMATTLLVQAQTPAFEWVQQVGDSAGDQGRSIARDAAGNLYVAGCFGKTVDFDPGPGVYNLTSSVGLELFVLKLDTAGNFEWAVKTTGWIGNLSEVALTCSDAGNVFVTGHFKDSVDFDPGSATFNLTSNGGRDIFIWHLNTNGNFV